MGSSQVREAEVFGRPSTWYFLATRSEHLSSSYGRAAGGRPGRARGVSSNSITRGVSVQIQLHDLSSASLTMYRWTLIDGRRAQSCLLFGVLKCTDTNTYISWCSLLDGLAAVVHARARAFQEASVLINRLVDLSSTFCINNW